jgi:cytoskeleton-associated protein 5
MNTWLEDLVGEVDSEVVVRFLAKKGWNEKNFQVSLHWRLICPNTMTKINFAQVSSKIYGILSMLAERCLSFSRSSAALSVPHLSEKLGDMKLRKPAGDTLLLFAEKTSLSFVLSQGEHSWTFEVAFILNIVHHASVWASLEAESA